MSTVRVKDVVRDGFTMTLATGEVAQMKLTGNADMEALPLVGPFLSQVNDWILQQGERRIIVDFRELYFMNSSCFKAMLTWISGIGKLDAGRRYTVRFLANPNLHWQSRNLDAVTQFAPSIVEVVTE
jgi:hypothetical protein